MIEVRHLTKKYDDHVAVEDLSFTVEDGMIYGFLGPNGAGKSTTMNIMTGYLAPTSGEILVNGHDILEEPEEAKRTVGYLPEVPPVYPDMTVGEYLLFAAELKKLPKGDRPSFVEKALEALSLEDVRDRLIRNLSKGYRQRVGFAQAILGEPETLILDEPTEGLDPKQIIEMRDLILRLGRQHTVILSSHILSEVAEVCDQVLIISEGRFVACDTPANLSAAGRGGLLLHLTAEGGAEQVETVLADVLTGLYPSAPEAWHLKVTERGEGLSEASVTLRSGEDVRAGISSALFAAGCPVVELTREEESLESIFLTLTEEHEATERSGEDRGRASDIQEEA